MNNQDKRKTLTVEQLRQRYNFEDIEKNKKATELIKETLNKVEVQFQRFIDIIKRSLNEYPNQADGNITAWFFNGIPTTTQPEFTTPLDHLGDVYYDRDSGKSYEYKLVDNNYEWVEITDSRTIEVLSIEASAADTNDNKRIVFIDQPEPTYSIGDIWINDGKYYRCRAKRIGEFEIYGDTTQSGTPTPSNPIPIINKTGLITEKIDDRDYQFNLGDIELCRIGDYQDVIRKSSGKNLFNKNDITTGKYYQASGLGDSDNWAIAQIEAKKDTHYYLSGNNRSNTSARIVLLDSSKNIIYDVGGYSEVHHFTTNVNTYYIGVSVANYSDDSDLDTLQLEEGTAATEYEPYGHVWYIHKEIGKLVLDGSESYTLVNTVDNNVMYRTTNAIFDSIPNNTTNYITNYFTTNTASYNSAEIGSYITSNQFRMRVPNTISDLNIWMEENNVIIYYALSNPVITEIVDSALLRQLNQINTGDFNILDWIIYTDYSDDMVAMDTTAELNQLRKEVEENYVSNATLETTVNGINGRVEETYQYTTTVANALGETDEELEEVKNTVLANQTATEYSINVINQQLIDGVVKFDTGTGYTFDIEGLKINKTGSIIRLILDNNGLVVYRNDDEVFRADSNGVNAENITVRKFYVQKPIRVEKTHAITDPTKVGLGLFWVGDN